MRILVAEADTHFLSAYETTNIAVSDYVTAQYFNEDTNTIDAEFEVDVTACIVFETEYDGSCYILFEDMTTAQNLVREAYNKGTLDLTPYAEQTIIAPSNLDCDMELIKKYEVSE